MHGLISEKIVLVKEAWTLRQIISICIFQIAQLFLDIYASVPTNCPYQM